ncbi:unnamed protein product [Musa banksii]
MNFTADLELYLMLPLRRCNTASSPLHRHHAAASLHATYHVSVHHYRAACAVPPIGRQTGSDYFTADTSSVFKDSKYFKMEQSDISREIGWLDPSCTHQQEISNRIGRQGCETKHSS